MKNNARATSVDLLRIFAASVIFYHHGGLAAGWPLAHWGEYAVATFIYLTSFCTVRYSKPVTGPLWRYWWTRFKAIYPTFAIFSVIIFAASFYYAPSKTGGHYTMADLGANLLMISGYIGRPWLTEPMWYIPFVLQIYFILPFLIKIPVRFYIMPAAFLVSGIASAAAYGLHPLHPDYAYGICRNWSPLFRLPEVMFGCALGRARNGSEVIAAVSVFLGCCALAVIGTAAYPQAMPTALMPLKGILVFLVLAAAVAVVLPFIKNEYSAMVAIGGRAAFPFFLLHGTGVGFVDHKFGRNILAWVFYFVLCWAAAVGFTLVLEKISRRPDKTRA